MLLLWQRSLMYKECTFLNVNALQILIIWIMYWINVINNVNVL